MPLSLQRPIVFFDLETTGTEVQNDRIVEISIVKLFVDGCEETYTTLVNPGIPIPEAASAIHGIRDADVVNKPKFIDISQEIIDRFDGSDLCGYNMIRFDLPLLRMEFYRNNLELNIAGSKLIDPMKIFMKKEPRDLTSALKFYCDIELADAHSAEADTLAAKKVLLAQVNHYTDLPNTVVELSDFCMQDIKIRFADITGKLIYNAINEVCFNFGQHKDQRVIDNREYVEWMITADFPIDTVTIIKRIHNII